MSWGTELWDQYDSLSIHSQKGIDFLEKVGHFMKDRCAIETEYAGKLRRLVKNYQPKKKEEDDYQFTPCKAFRVMMNEINDLAGQHEVVAENLGASVIRDLTLLTKELKEERKKHLNEGSKLSQTLQAQEIVLERSHRNYEKAFREAERAIDNYQRAEADLNLSRADVEKQRINMTSKSQQCEETKIEYANQLQKTNDLRRSHYNLLLPEVFRQLQELDEKRIKNIKNFIHNSAEIERNVFPIISKCIDGIVRAGDLINEKEDTLMVIERYKSGFVPPGDHPFEDLSKSGGSGNGIGGDSIDGHRGGSDPSLHHQQHHTVKGTMSGGKLKKRVGIFGIFSSNKNNMSMDAKEDYGDLPPNQRRKRLEAKLQELKKQVNQEQAAMDGLMKMKGVYEANTALGDPMTVEGQLNECCNKLEKLHAEVARYSNWLESAQGGAGVGNGAGASNNTGAIAPYSHSKLNGGGVHRHSIGSNEESLSRSESDSSVSAPAHKNSAPNTPQPNHGSGGSPESGLGTSHNSLGAGGPTVAVSEIETSEFDGEFYPEEPLQPLGTCKALYPFEATSEGSMGMQEGEELLLVELDQGDGWTRVRRAHLAQEGFVPTTYIQCTLYS
ncbi:formin-binding protein 1-like Cip4 isoform X5 [Arctopsyche grandis]|uniref:formin-binding protein 1-like Cip4 isoform X4 n=1 Tax=Arctopsyche grandis TaxID=121162 RepID=UPI00406D71CE